MKTKDIKMVNEKIIPMSWTGWDKQDELYNTYYDAVFNSAFGVFKKGEKYPSVEVDYSNGLIIAYNEFGGEAKRQEWSAKATPKPKKEKEAKVEEAKAE